MNEPTALGMVLAMLVDRNGKPVRSGSGRGQLYATREWLVVLRPKGAHETLHRATRAALFASVAILIANLFIWKSMGAIWIAMALQAAYWLSLPMRRRALEPKALSAADLEAARRAGQPLVQIPAGAIVRAVAPQPPRPGFRKPARFETPEGALEIYLSDDQFRSALEALGRSP